MLAAWRCPVTTVVIVGTRTLGVQHLGVVVEEDGNVVTPEFDLDELEYMDDEERREILEEAGLDPDEYDF